MQPLVPGHRVELFPPRSPDLNPVEHAWSWIKRALGRKHLTPAQVRPRVQELWDQIPSGVISAWISSMPSRVAAVIAARGGHTAY